MKDLKRRIRSVGYRIQYLATRATVDASKPRTVVFAALLTVGV